MPHRRVILADTGHDEGVVTTAPPITHVPATTRRAGARLRVVAWCVAAGALIALSVPPAGFWPLAIVGVALWDRLLAGQPMRTRATRSFVVAAAWLFPMMLWMWDLTAPGYLIAGLGFAGYFAAAGAAVPPGPGRWLVLPAALALAELARWSFPYEGVPLATLAMGQANSVLAQPARLGGALLVSAMVGVAGVALSAASQRRWRPAAIATAVVVAAVVLGAVAPRGEPVGSLDVAAVQGGGPQRTRASTSDAQAVFERHVEATALVTTPVDLVVWPENVVSVEGVLAGSAVGAEISDLSRSLDAPLVVGVTEGISDTEFLNASIVYLPDGTVGERYDKVLRVPFGEYVPWRGLLEKLAPNAGLPGRDARAGTMPAVLATPAGPLGVAISWEVFFTGRVRDGVTNGGQVLINPTNGSSYWLTQVQSQQVASSQLRAIETGRWVVQASPTGFSAIVNQNGTVIERTNLGEQRVLQHTVDRRTGTTLATWLGPLPVALLAAAAVVAGWWVQRRPARRPPDPVTPQRAP
jgi:apolipoprotein N-acyltransferase